MKLTSTGVQLANDILAVMNRKAERIAVPGEYKVYRTEDESVFLEIKGTTYAL